MRGTIIAELKAFAKSEDGSTAVEYGLIGLSLGLVLVATMPVFASSVKGIYDHILTSVLVALSWS